MATAIGVAAAVVSVGGAYVSYEQERTNIEAQMRRAEIIKKSAEREIEIAEERKTRELRLERRRALTELRIEEDQIAFEVEVERQRSISIKKQITKEERRVVSGQRAGYAASGIKMSGSALRVMETTSNEAEEERTEVTTGYQLYKTAREKEVTALETRTALSLAEHQERLTAETGYEVEAKEFEITHAEAIMGSGRESLTWAKYGFLANAAGGALKGYAMGAA